VSIVSSRHGPDDKLDSCPTEWNVKLSEVIAPFSANAQPMNTALATLGCPLQVQPV